MESYASKVIIKKMHTLLTIPFKGPIESVGRISLMSTLIALLTLLTTYAHAQSNYPQGVSQKIMTVLLHSPPKAQQLPNPGDLMELTVVLKNTRDTNRKLKALIVRDGQLMEVTIPSAKFNSQEEPSYTFTIHAPVGELLYQFLLYNSDDTFTSSEKFFIQRSCIPDVSLAPEHLAPESDGEKRIADLVAQAKSLEKDIDNYEQIIMLLGEIQKLTGSRS